MADQPIQFTLGITADGKVMVDLGDTKVDHLLLTEEQALYMAEGLVEAAREAGFGYAGILRAG